jgi:hypothetical protein
MFAPLADPQRNPEVRIVRQRELMIAKQFLMLMRLSIHGSNVKFQLLIVASGMNNRWPDAAAPARLVTATCHGEVPQCGTKTEA